MQLYGHTHIFEKLTKSPAHTAGKPYCFIGPYKIGKMHTALCVAEKLLPKTQGKLIENHPDVFIVRREKNPETGKTKKHIDLSQIQGLQQFISRNSALGGLRVAIIDQAELCHEQAQQALLKTIEELPKQVIVIFLIPDTEFLLPTIISRCHLIHFSSLSLKDMEACAEAFGCFDKKMIVDVKIVL